MNWTKIWNSRFLTIKNKKSFHSTNLKNSLMLNGHRDGAGFISLNNWKKYGEYLKNFFEILPEASIYEVGCGAGAFLYLFRENYKIGGCDYSNSLVKYCKKLLPNFKSNILNMNATKIKIADKYDFVIAHGLFHYLTLKDATFILKKMIKKSKKNCLVLDVPDHYYKKKYINLRKKKTFNYFKKYQGLEHTFYSKFFFTKIAKENNCEIFFFRSKIKNYKQGIYRFNLCLKKR